MCVCLCEGDARWRCGIYLMSSSSSRILCMYLCSACVCLKISGCCWCCRYCCCRWSRSLQTLVVCFFFFFSLFYCCVSCASSIVSVTVYCFAVFIYFVFHFCVFPSSSLAFFAICTVSPPCVHPAIGTYYEPSTFFFFFVSCLRLGFYAIQTKPIYLVSCCTSQRINVHFILSVIVSLPLPIVVVVVFVTENSFGTFFQYIIERNNGPSRESRKRKKKTK